MSVMFIAEIIPIKRVAVVDSLVIPILLMIVIFAFLRFRETGLLKSVIYAFFNFSVWSNTEEKSRGNNAALLLSVNAFIGLGVFIYMFLINYLGIESSLWVLTMISSLFFIWYWIKKLLIYSIGTVTEEKNLLKEVRSYNLYYYQLLGVFLIPGLLFALIAPGNILQLSPEVPFYISNLGLLYCIIVASILYVFKLLQSFRQSGGGNVSLYYIILYLCTLEILPLIVSYRVLVGNFTMFN